jgi:hypothetical protein
VPRSKKPQDGIVEIRVYHPQSEDPPTIPDKMPDYEKVFEELFLPDEDGHSITFQVVKGPMGSLAEVHMQPGISPQTAAALLRKLAGLLERHGQTVLNLSIGEEGRFAGPTGRLEVYE